MSHCQGGSIFPEGCAPEADPRGSVQYLEQSGGSRQRRSLDAAWISVGRTLSSVAGGTDGNDLLADRPPADELRRSRSEFLKRRRVGFGSVTICDNYMQFIQAN